MKYKILWILAFLAIIADFGITILLVQSDEIREANENAVELMEEHGEIGGMLITVLIRYGILFIGMIVQKLCPIHEWIIPTMLLTVSVAPALWNLWIFVETFIPMWVLLFV